ncbi:MAG TPA: septum formation initiator, partial [Sphingobium sp.]|nr:septum formation initiator [Sphingobium sp.]
MTVEQIVARAPDGKRLGTLVVPSLVAAERDTDRPVIFAFNGGPGSASGWLQLGLLGPLRVVLPDDPAKAIPPSPPFERAKDGLWDLADIVFIDPLGTGFSRVDAGVPDALVQDWRGDGDYIAGAIREWLTRHGRADAPVLLIGESYGTERAVAVADALTRGDRPVRLAGVVLVSQSITVENTLQRNGNDLGTAIGLPTIAATACYWKKAEGAPKNCAADAQEYALGHYLPALAAGNQLSTERRAAVERRMSRITGLPADHFNKNGLPLTKDAYRHLALAKDGRLLGVYDSRYAAPVDPARKGQDPSFD